MYPHPEKKRLFEYCNYLKSPRPPIRNYVIHVWPLMRGSILKELRAPTWMEWIESPWKGYGFSLMTFVEPPMWKLIEICSKLYLQLYCVPQRSRVKWRVGRHLNFGSRGELVEGGRWRSDLLDDDGDVHMPGGPCRHVKLCVGLTSLCLCSLCIVKKCLHVYFISPNGSIAND